MRKQRVYFETTIFNYYFQPERDAHRATLHLFSALEQGKLEVFTSQFVIDELMLAPSPKREQMLELIARYGIPVLQPSEEAAKLAVLYLETGALPPASTADSLHIAIASVYGLDLIISLNFEHIVRQRTRRMTAAVNTLYGYSAVEILSPMEVDWNE